MRESSLLKRFRICPLSCSPPGARRALLLLLTLAAVLGGISRVGAQPAENDMIRGTVSIHGTWNRYHPVYLADNDLPLLSFAEGSWVRSIPIRVAIHNNTPERRLVEFVGKRSSHGHGMWSGATVDGGTRTHGSVELEPFTSTEVDAGFQMRARTRMHTIPPFGWVPEDGTYHVNQFDEVEEQYPGSSHVTAEGDAVIHIELKGALGDPVSPDPVDRCWLFIEPDMDVRLTYAKVQYSGWTTHAGSAQIPTIHLYVGDVPDEGRGGHDRLEVDFTLRNEQLDGAKEVRLRVGNRIYELEPTHGGRPARIDERSFSLLDVHHGGPLTSSDVELQIGNRTLRSAQTPAVFPDGLHRIDFGTIALTEDCGPCTTGDCVSGAATASLESVDFVVDLGNAGRGKGTMQLALRSESITPETHAVAAFDYLGMRNGPVELIDGLPDRRQFKGPSGLADLQEERDASGALLKTILRLYRQPGEKVDGFYPGSEEYKRLEFESFTASQRPALRVTSLEAGRTEVTEYLHEPESALWTLRTGNGARSETLRKVVAADGGSTVETREIFDRDGTLLSKIRETVTHYPWGDRVTERVVDPEGAALTSTWAYAAHGAAPDFGVLRSRMRSNGYWEEYRHNQKGLLWKVVSQYLDAPHGSPEEEVRVRTISRYVDQTIDTVTERGKIVAMSIEWRGDSPEGAVVQNETATRPDAFLGAFWNLVERTVYLSNGTRTRNPNGTLTIVREEEDPQNGHSRTITESGAPNETETAVVSGTRLTETFDVQGEPILSETVDIESGLLLARREVLSQDPMGRPLHVSYLDGSHETFDYACCGLRRTRSRDGSVTHLTYDDLKHVATRSTGGITRIYERDALGRVRRELREGTDGSQTIVAETDYDLAGRPVREFNGVSDTQIAYEDEGNGLHRVTRTFADGGAAITRTYPDGNPFERTGSAVAPVRYEYLHYTHGITAVTEIYLGENGGTAHWLERVSMMQDWPLELVGSDGTYESFQFNRLGQLTEHYDSDGVHTWFSYDAHGRLAERTIEADGSFFPSDADRRWRYAYEVLATEDGVAREERTEVGTETGFVETERTTRFLEKDQQAVTRYGQTTSITTAVPADDRRIVTTTLPDGSTEEQQYLDGRLIEEARFDANGTRIGGQRYAYDPHGRLGTTVDLGNGAVQEERTYFANDLMESTRTGSGSLTSYRYDVMGRASEITLPGEGRTITRSFDAQGNVLTEGGSATYPIAYTYDPQGRLTTLTTSSGTTTWEYEPWSGRLASRRDAEGEAVTYTWSDAGRLSSRTWARGIQTDYRYNPAGELIEIDYSDETPDIALRRDTRGRIIEVDDATGSRSLTYTDSNLPTGEQFADASLFSGLVTEFTYDALDRRVATRVLTTDGSLLSEATTTYDAASRLSGVGFEGEQATYEYAPDASRIAALTITGPSGTPLRTEREFDATNRLIEIRTITGGGEQYRTSYGFDAAGRRSTIADERGRQWRYGYNARSEVTTGRKFAGDNSDLSGYDFGYAFDDLGNRLTSTRNGRMTGYTPNALNQYESRTTPGVLDLLGTAHPEAEVRINGLLASRQGEQFHGILEADNAAGPAYQETTVTATLDGNTESESGRLFVPAAQESFTYDADGNLTSDSRWTYTWNGANRLVAMEPTPEALAAGVPREAYTFTYDYLGRRALRTQTRSGTVPASDEPSSGSAEPTAVRFLYDGWNLLAEVDEQNTPLRTYAWGTDLSGTPQGAGGIGGLLFLQTENQTHTPRYDGNGNVLGLHHLQANGTPSATYEYAPFGELLQATGPLAQKNPFRFSTKYTDPTGLVYYGFRFYNPAFGRWLTRDPIGEAGGVNMYAVLGNSVSHQFDFLGLADITLELDRTSADYLGTYGELSVTSDDPDVLKCCGRLPTFKTIEPPMGTYRNPGDAGVKRYPLQTRNSLIRNPLRPSNHTNPMNVLGAFDLPARPVGVPEDQYARAMTSSLFIGQGSVAIHAGCWSGHSRLCTLVGTQFVERRQSNVQNPYPAIQVGESYSVVGFDRDDTLQSQLSINLWVVCVENHLERPATLEFKRTGSPKIPANETAPTPLSPGEEASGSSESGFNLLRWLSGG